jgi:hypothetical protein
MEAKYNHRIIGTKVVAHGTIVVLFMIMARLPTISTDNIKHGTIITCFSYHNTVITRSAVMNQCFKILLIMESYILVLYMLELTLQLKKGDPSKLTQIYATTPNWATDRVINESLKIVVSGIGHLNHHQIYVTRESSRRGRRFKSSRDFIVESHRLCKSKKGRPETLPFSFLLRVKE